MRSRLLLLLSLRGHHQPVFYPSGTCRRIIPTVPATDPPLLPTLRRAFRLRDSKYSLRSMVPGSDAQAGPSEVRKIGHAMLLPRLRRRAPYPQLAAAVLLRGM